MDLAAIFTNDNKNGNVGEKQKVKRNLMTGQGQGKKSDVNKQRDVPKQHIERLQKDNEKSKVMKLLMIEGVKHMMVGSEDLFLKKMDIGKGNPLKKDLWRISDQIVKMKKNLMELDSQAKGLMEACNSLIAENALREREMSLEFETKKKYFEDTLKDLQTRNNYLKNIYNCYQSAYNISVRKENNNYICITTMKDQEISFMFSINGAYTTYTPLKVSFGANNFLNYTIEDLNRNELAILFIRLMKLVLTR